MIASVKSAYARTIAKLRNSMNRRGFLFRLLLVMVSVICIPLAGMSAYWINERKESVLDGKYAELQGVANSVAARLNTSFEIIRVTDINVKTDSAISDALDGMRPLKEAELIHNTLNTLSMLMPIIEDFGYYNQQTGALYMATGKYIPEIYARYVAGEAPEFFEKRLIDADRPMFLPWNDKGKYFAYIVPPVSVYGGKRGIVGYYRVSAQSVQSSLEGTLVAPFALLRLEATDGTLLYPANSGANCALTVNILGKYVNATVGVSHEYVEAAIAQLNEFSLMLMVFCALVLLVDVLALLAVGYAPVYRLMRNVRDYSGIPSEGQHELEYMMDVVENAVNQKQRIQRRMRSEHRMLEDRLAEALISGRQMSDDELQHLSLAEANAVICVYAKALDDLDECLNNVRLGGARYFVEMPDDGVIALIYGLSDDTRASRAAAADSVRKFMNLGKRVALGIGGACDQRRELCRSYREALTALAAARGDDAYFEDLPADCIHTNGDPPTQTNREGIHERLSRYVDERFTDADFGTGVIAQHFGMSEYMAGKLMRELYGSNYSRYINERRLEYAKNCLYTTAMSVAEIAQAAGFMSSTYFGRVFRKVEGMSPMEWRKQMRFENARGDMNAYDDEE